MAELRRLASSCEFGDFLDDALRDGLVCGLSNEAAQRRLLTEAKLTFTGALELAKSQEIAELQIKQLKCPDLGVNKLSRMKHCEKESGEKCSHCGRRNHSSGQCRLKDLSCHKCGEKGRIAAVCRNKTKAKWVDVEEDQDGDQCHMIATIGRRQSPMVPGFQWR